MTDQGVPCHLLWLAKSEKGILEKDLKFSPKYQPKDLIDQIPDHMKIIWLAKNKLVIPEKILDYNLEQYPSYRKMGIPNPERFDFPHCTCLKMPV